MVTPELDEPGPIDQEVGVDVLGTGRHCQISDDFRTRVSEGLSGGEKLRDRGIRVEVQVSANPHARQPDRATTVEITLRSRGPVVRAEASADEKLIAFEHALDRLKSQLRRAADRRKVHRGLRAGQQFGAPPPVAAPPQDTPPWLAASAASSKARMRTMVR